MAADKRVTERTFGVPRPYAAHLGGPLKRGDLVILQRGITRMIHEIIDITHDTSGGPQEASDLALFPVLGETRRLPSVQDQIDRLGADFRISKK